MSDFDEQLRRALTRRAGRAVVSDDALQQMAERRARLRRRQVAGATAIAAGVVIAALVALTTLWTGDQDTISFVDQVATPIPSMRPDPTASPAIEPTDRGSAPPRFTESAAPLDPAAIDLAQIASPDVFDLGALTVIADVTVLPDGVVVAVGSHVPDNAGAGAATAWISEGAGNWRVIRDVDAGATAEDAAMTRTAAFGDSVVAIGSFGRDASAWRSDDGVTWTRSAPGAFGPDSVVHDVTTDGARLVAVGEIVVGDVRQGVVWTSSDGLVWQRVDGLPPAATVDHVATGPAGVVALTRDNLAVWSTGRQPSWVQVGTPFGAGVTDVFAATRDAYVRVGLQDTGADEVSWRLMVSTSSTIEEWSTHGVADSRMSRAEDLAVVSDTIVVVGSDESGPTSRPAVFAGSRHGRDWRRVHSGRRAGVMHGVAVTDDRIVVVGESGDTRQASTAGAVWEAPLP